MEPSSTRVSPARVAVAIIVPVLPFAAAMFGGFVMVVLGAPLAAVMIRPLGSWRAWTWVAAAVTLAATAWGAFTWLQVNAHCTVQGPVAPAVAAGVSVLVGTLVGAWVAGPSGSVLRALVGAAVAAIVTLLVGALSIYLSVVLGLPAFLVSYSHC